MAQALDTTYEGLTNIAQLTAEQRLYGRTSDILRLVQGNKPAMRVMYNNFKSKGGTAIVTDMEFKYKSEVPRPTLVPIGVASTPDSGAENVFGILNKYAPYIEVGAELICRDLFTRSNGGTTNWSTTRGTSGATENEVMRVIAKSVAGATYTTFTVTRNVSPAHGGTTPGDVTAAGGNLTTAMYVIIMPKVQAIGSNEGTVYGDTPHEETNYCEINFGKWGVPRTMENIKQLQNESISARNGRRQLELFWDTVEWRQIFRKKVTGVDGQGRQWYTTGALDEYIETAQSGISYTPYIGAANVDNHVIDFQGTYGNVNYQNLNKFGQNKFFWGSMEKWWIMDNKQYTAITNSFDNKIRIIYNQSLSERYGFKINSLDISGGGTFHLVQSDAFSINGMSDLSYIVDFNYFKHCHLQNEDFTIMLDVEKGLNPLIKINYLYMNSGIIRRNPFAHYKVYNMVS
jgi:hypothetical protein